jgi:hypothetical protein
MRLRPLAILCSWLMVANCTGSGTSADKSAEAARADSSAAGYAVGIDTSQSSASNHAQTIDTATTASRDTARPRINARPRIDTSEIHRVVRARSDSSVRRTRSDSSKPPSLPLPVGLTRVNEFLSYDAQKKTVTLLLTAGYNGLNDALNYNGGARGSQGVSIPLGWTVLVSLTNRDSDLQHSAIVVRQMLPPPEEMPAPAFAGASLRQLEEGVPEGDTASFEFIAARPGQFMVACGVPGHAQGGMWLRLTISADIDRPAYR